MRPLLVLIGLSGALAPAPASAAEAYEVVEGFNGKGKFEKAAKVCDKESADSDETSMSLRSPCAEAYFQLLILQDPDADTLYAFAQTWAGTSHGGSALDRAAHLSMPPPTSDEDTFYNHSVRFKGTAAAIGSSAIATRKGFESASDADSVTGWQAFLARYPDTKYSVDAVAAEEDSAWRDALAVNTPEAWQTVADGYPDRANDALSRVSASIALRVKEGLAVSPGCSTNRPCHAIESGETITVAWPRTPVERLTVQLLGSDLGSPYAWLTTDEVYTSLLAEALAGDLSETGWTLSAPFPLRNAPSGAGLALQVQVDDQEPIVVQLVFDSAYPSELVDGLLHVGDGALWVTTDPAAAPTRLWNLPTNDQWLLHPDGRTFWAWGDDGLQRWDFATGARTTVATDATDLAAPCGDGVTYRDAATGQLRSVPPHLAEYNLLALSGGTWTRVLDARPGMAVLEEPNGIRLSGEMDLLLEGARAEHAALNDDGSRLATVLPGAPGALEIWDTSFGTSFLTVALNGDDPMVRWVGESVVIKTGDCDDCYSTLAVSDGEFVPSNASVWHNAAPHPWAPEPSVPADITVAVTEAVMTTTLGETTHQFNLDAPPPEMLETAGECAEASRLTWSWIEGGRSILLVQQTHACSGRPLTGAATANPIDGTVQPIGFGFLGTPEERLTALLSRSTRHGVATWRAGWQPNAAPVPTDTLRVAAMPMLTLRAAPAPIADQDDG